MLKPQSNRPGNQPLQPTTGKLNWLVRYFLNDLNGLKTNQRKKEKIRLVRYLANDFNRLRNTPNYHFSYIYHTVVGYICGQVCLDQIALPKTVYSRKPNDDGPPVYLDEAPVFLGSEEDAV
jgi:hypothetical protein